MAISLVRVGSLLDQSPVELIVYLTNFPGLDRILSSEMSGDGLPERKPVARNLLKIIGRYQ